ncbi:MAG: ribonuclease Z [Lachnospiraceae bacterium]|nr:ribonuclease Z [Lachnospiraceae bacterium]
MLDVSLLGTGGMMPLPNRYLTSCLLRYNGSNVLIDCGEGTQTALRRRGWSCKPIDTILLTHFHADHIAGLPGLLLTMGNAERTEPVTIIGPRGIDRILQAVRTIAPELPFETKTLEIEENEQTFSRNGMEMTAFREKHGIVCYGWEIHIPRQGKFNVEEAKRRSIPLKFWNPLQKGETITDEDGTVYTPDMVLGADRPGIKMVYATDTRPVPAIAEHARNADLLICEGMYGEDGMEAKAREHRHMTMQEAARIAQEAQPREMWLTHFSPSVVHPEDYLDKIRAIFPRTIVPKDGRTTSIAFREE